MNKILVPTDFSEQATYAMDVACQIAKKNTCEIVALHVLDYTGLFDFSVGSSAYPMMGAPAGLDLDQQFMETLHRNAEEKCVKFLAPYQDAGLHITKKIKIGSTYQYITDEVADNNIDLIIIGSKGVSGIEDTFIGSNTEKIVRHSKCPVLVVKSKTDIGKIKNIVFATNFKEEQGHVAEEIKKLQDIFEATLHLVRINTPDNFEPSRKIHRLADAFVQKNKLTNYTINVYCDKVEEDGIIFFSQDINADMIALATHGRTGILHLLSGSIAEDVANHAKRPVWTFRIIK